MAITSAPQRSGHQAPHSQAILIVTVVAAMILAGLGVAVALLGHAGRSSGSGVRGSGVGASQTRPLPGFSSLDLAGSNGVTVLVGAPQSVVVHADSNLISNVTTSVVGGTLIIGDTGSFTTRSPMNVDVSVPSLTALTLSGDGQLSVTGVSVPELTVTIPGSGLLSASGTATRLDVTLDGDGQAQLSQLAARDVHAVLAGSGLIQVHATTSLDAAVPGSGMIMYSGNPSHVATSVTGSGTVVGR
jgi:Putative auto-transporter adhesin, head GIN domain